MNQQEKAPNDNDNSGSRTAGFAAMGDSLNKPVFFISGGLIILFSLYGFLFVDHAAITFAAAQSWLTTNLGWFYMSVVAVFFGFILYLVFSRFAHIKLGPDDSEPDYTYKSWFAMLFSAGVGIGLLFFGVAEPMTHFLMPPTGEGGTVEAAQRAMEITFFHWGFQAWAVYILVGLSLAYFSFRHNLPLTPRSALYPIFGDRIYGPVGHAVDVFAVLGTMFGVATSLGIGVTQVNAGLDYLFDIGVSPAIQIGLIGAITAMATVSVIAGLDGGIRRLSELNMTLAIFMLAFILLAGPTVTLLDAFIQNLGGYFSNMFEMTLTPYAYRDSEWMGNWTLFYWAWWIAWAPFVGMFIARISRGRTIREFILGVLLVPSGFSFLWLSFFGNTALTMELAGNAGNLAQAVQNDMPTALFVMLERMPFPTIIPIITTVLIVTFFVTSSDSGSLVIDIITSGGAEEPPVWQRVFWAITEGVVAAVLLVAGGLNALQTASLMSALPFSIVMLFICYGLWKGLNMEAVRRPYQPYPAANIPHEASPKVWQGRLQALLGQHRKQDVQEYLAQTVRPAMDAVMLQIDRTKLSASIEEANNLVRLWIGYDGDQYFKYEIKLREYKLATVAFPELPRRDSGKSYWRAEVFLMEGPQHYDVAGYSKDQLISDMLAQFELHMQMLHLEH